VNGQSERGFSVTIDGRYQDLKSLRERVSGWLLAQGINGAVGDQIVLATHEAAAGAIETGHSKITIAASVGREVAVVSVTTEGLTPVLDLRDYEERFRLLNRLASAVRVETTSSHSSLRLELPASA